MSTYSPELREKIKSKYAELRGLGWSRSEARYMAEEHVIRELGRDGVGGNAYFEDDARGFDLNNGDRYGSREADNHGWNTGSNPSEAYDFKPSVQTKAFDLECLAAQVFDECLRVGMSMRAAHHHRLAFMQEARGNRPRTWIFDDFDELKQVPLGDEPCTERGSGRGGDRHEPTPHVASDTPSYGRTSGRRPIFVELYKWCFHPFEFVFGGSSNRQSSESFPPSLFCASHERWAKKPYHTEERKPERPLKSSEGAEFTSPYTTYTTGSHRYATSYRFPRGNLAFEWTFFESGQRPRSDHGTSNTHRFSGNHQQPRNRHHRDESRSRNRRGPHPSGPQRAGPRPSDASSTLPQGIKPIVCFYDILGVPKTASAEAIKKAHRTLSLRWHPDRAAPWQRREATEKMALVNQARDVLLNDNQRAYYDRTGWIPPNMRV